MFCPTCNQLLQKLSVTTSSGGKFDIDHCGRCGGSWFDPYEINRIPTHEVARIAKLTVLPQIPVDEPQIHRCPRCHKHLVNSHYESIPKGVLMLRCTKCGGIWATQKALAEFKKHQDDTIREYKVGNTAFPSLSVVFVPALFVLMLLVVTFTTVATLQESKDGRTRAENNISNLTTFPVSPTQVNLVFMTKTPLKSRITYGVDPFSLQTQTVSDKPSVNHFIILRNLNPQSLYIFKITLEDDQGRTFSTGENTFITKGN